LARNPVHSVLFLVLVFLNSAMLIFFLGAEFLSMIIIVVYVGAVAVLFLFVCMMLNIKIELNNNIFQNVVSNCIVWWFISFINRYVIV
jgi:NADH-quinone oxidoreductase subunit J